jgi:hypothetical protein
METITQKAYWDEVASLAKNCADEAKEQERELSEVVWETCDGHQWVIYTFYQFQILQHTGQDVADRFSDMGGPDLKQGWDHVVMQAAFLAPEGDVMERAQELMNESEESEG